MLFRVHPSSGVPLYRQIVDQAKVLVATGQLAPGDRLPSVRALSEQLVINPTTVQRAYLDLEKDGVIETRRGQGTFVREAARFALPVAARRAQAAEHLQQAVAEARRLQLDGDELIRLFAREVARVYGEEAAAWLRPPAKEKSR